MKYWLNKYYKIITSVISLFINSIGLALSIYGAIQVENQTTVDTYITFLLVSAEVFLILSVIYTIISSINNYNNRISVEEKEAELIRFKDANRTILENNKAIITTYKDFQDKLHMVIKQHLDSLAKVESLESSLKSPSLPCRSTQEFNK